MMTWIFSPTLSFKSSTGFIGDGRHHDRPADVNQNVGGGSALLDLHNLSGKSIASRNLHSLSFRVYDEACLSWHRLAANMMYAGARAYVGTLFPVLPLEASEVVKKVLDEYWGKPLAIAAWAAQRDVYGSDLRRPCVVAGVFCQCLHIDAIDYPKRIKRQLAETLTGYKEMLVSLEPSGDAKRIAALKDVIKIYERECEHFGKRSAGLLIRP
jgi:hypothetical protein